MRYLEKLLKGAKVEYLPLGDKRIGKFIRGGGLQKKDFTSEGVGCIHYGQIYTHYGTCAYTTKTFVSKEFAKKARMAQTGDLVIATTSENDEDVCKAVAWLGKEDIAISSDACFYNHNLNPKYVAYYFQTVDFQKQKRPLITGTKVRRVNANDLAKIIIPIPPLSVQKEIVRILDTFTQVTAELSAELSARKKQYDFYREQLFTFDEGKVEWKTLGEVGDIKMCKRILKHETNSEEGVPFYKIGTFGKQANAYISHEMYDLYKNKYSFPDKGDILISAAGTIGRTVVYDGEPAYFQDSNIVWIDNDESIVTNKYLWHYYSIIKWFISGGGTIDRLYNDNIKKSKIPVPYPNDPQKSLSEQERIVSILDKFDTLTTSISEGLPREIEQRKQQYEYYREMLLTFPKEEQ